MKDSSVQRFTTDDLLRRFDPAARCEHYLDLLAKEGRRHNLVSRETSRAELRRLVAESLIPLALLTDIVPHSYLDIGSGGGLPSLPLLIALSQLGSCPSRSVLVERTQKKASALRRMLIALELRAEIVPCDFAPSAVSGPFDLVTLRLVRLTPDLQAAIAQAIAPGGALVHWAAIDTIGPGADWDIREVPFSIDSENVTRTLTILRKN